MSQEGADFATATTNYLNAKPEKRRRENYFKYWGLPNRGLNSTVYVLDTGFDADIFVSQSWHGPGISHYVIRRKQARRLTGSASASILQTNIKN